MTDKLSIKLEKWGFSGVRGVQGAIPADLLLQIELHYVNLREKCFS